MVFLVNDFWPYPAWKMQPRQWFQIWSCSSWRVRLVLGSWAKILTELKNWWACSGRPGLYRSTSWWDRREGSGWGCLYVLRFGQQVTDAHNKGMRYVWRQRKSACWIPLFHQAPYWMHLCHLLQVHRRNKFHGECEAYNVSSLYIFDLVVVYLTHR